MFFLSLCLIFVATFVNQAKAKSFALRLATSISFVLVAIMGVVQWGMNQITGEGINGAVFYHLSTGLEGGDVTEYTWPIVGGVVFVGIVVFLSVLLYRKTKIAGVANAKFGLAGAGVLVLTFVVNPFVTDVFAYATLGLGARQSNEGFVIPELAKAPDAPKNLILIYAESLERSYMNPALFPGLMPELSTLEASALHFTDVGQTDGAGFTIGGMVASQCGVPLLITGSENSLKVSQFLTGATCLGDILKQAGYNTAYVGGADITFAGKGAFYKSHNYDEVLGLNELRPGLAEPDYLGPWGLQDDTLFAVLRAKLDALAARPEPFALTTLTLDTHHPFGHANTNRACKDVKYQDGSNAMLTSVACADKLISGLIRDIQATPYAQNTLIVLMSDHQAMINGASEILNSQPRSNLFMIIDPSNPGARAITRPATTLDVGPTILSLLGFDIKAMGFGVDLLSEQPTLAEIKGPAEKGTNYAAHFAGYRDVFRGLWAYPKTEQGGYINLEAATVSFGKTETTFPLLIDVSQEGAITDMIIDDKAAGKPLSWFVFEKDQGVGFVWIDDCTKIAIATNLAKPDTDVCLLKGHAGTTDVSIKGITKSGFLSEADLSPRTEPLVADTTFDERVKNLAIAEGGLPLDIQLYTQSYSGPDIVLSSAGFGGGATFTRKITIDSLESGEDTLLGRGLTFVSLAQDGTLTLIDQIDTCVPAAGFDIATQAPFASKMDPAAVAHLIIAHDSAICEPLSNAMVARATEGLGLTQVPEIGFREPYIAVLQNGQASVELAGNEGTMRLARLTTKAVVPPQDIEAIRQKLTPVTVTSPAPEPAPAPEQVAVLPATEAPLATPNQAPAAQVPQAQPNPQSIPAMCIIPNDKPLIDATTALPDQNFAFLNLVAEGRLVLGAGTWNPEVAGVWLGAEKSDFSLLIPTDNRKASLSITLAAFKFATFPVKISIGDTVVFEAEVNSEISFVVDASRFEKGKALRLSIILPQEKPVCPAFFEPDGDTRVLRAMLQNVQLVWGAQEQAAVVTTPAMRTVAHGGGRVNGISVSDSIDALEVNKAKFDLLELDLNWTSDKQLVCIHDWTEAFDVRFGAETARPVTLAQFSALLAQGPNPGLQNCTMETLGNWLRENPDERVVTDVKENNTEALAMIAALMPDLKKQFVPQAYAAQEIDQIKAMGFDDVIWTLYRDGASDAAVIEMAKQHKPFAITMPVERAQAGLANRIKSEAGVAIFAHTVNDPALAACLQKQGVDGIYTDEMDPVILAKTTCPTL